MDHNHILCKFLENNINVHPSALDEIERLCSNVELDRIVNITKEESPSVVTSEFIKGLEGREEEKVVGERKSPLAKEIGSSIEIDRERDITSKSYTSGKVENFVGFFNIRYERLGKILKGRRSMLGAGMIEVVKSSRTREGRIVGMVNDIRETKNKHILMELEDPSGVLKALIPKNEEDLKELAREIIQDEIIGISGSFGNSGDLFIVKEVFFPDLPNNREARKSPEPVSLALISDLHIGNRHFQEGTFKRFVKWLRGEEGTSSQREAASRVKYVVVGGDLVDGVGIYPEQKDELEIKNITEQYARFYEHVSMLPEHIEVIISPGNHDATRQAEPQPAISEEFAPQCYEDPRIHMAGNPLSVELHGVKVVSYHGRGLDDIISTIPGLSYSRPEEAMLRLLRKRHLSPIYGGRVPLAPESYDYLLLEDPPDILHMGHVHTTGMKNYRNSLLVNSGTFQAQTAFQRKMNIMPTPGRVPIVDLQTLQTITMEF